MKDRKHRLGLLTAALAICVVGATSTASAHGNKGERFKRWDKNGDGYITQDEVNERKWARIQVADANSDSKISREELQKAHEEGKIKKKHKDGDCKHRKGKQKEA